jgi:hypothetical protein
VSIIISAVLAVRHLPLDESTDEQQLCPLGQQQVAAVTAIALQRML